MLDEHRPCRSGGCDPTLLTLALVHDPLWDVVNVRFWSGGGGVHTGALTSPTMVPMRVCPEG